MDVFKKAGDSLAGRFFEFRLHPLDLKEIKSVAGPDKLEEKLDRLLNVLGPAVFKVLSAGEHPET